MFTGTLQTMSRGEAKEKAKRMGAQVGSTVTKNTDVLVCGENPGSKYDRAKEWGVVIWTEEDFCVNSSMDVV